ncbi:histidine decarboxylase-like [Pomacea canaliculata]|uniref:histidine decarboxylase-like n=1 Tax=Pomacea canaliculata TaxID=400727 RepID=UPI000D738E03|nr:histidine decarboxylase-like [Pomacea canaliculata]XP_025080637.1 histidine decarboxylase-like [Pomacea canaliculata]XP_025080638.1 histidine decarboxylase-like [Pomacea canaliculata]XP_025080639.1 histidine decarboxylase-like [Pomacea canaliculata]
MDFNEYRQRGKEMVDYIADYLQNIRKRRVFPDVSPGYMRALVPESAPEHGEYWEDIFKDVERVIMPGITHWQSPKMHAYFPALNSFPSLLGDMLADAIGCLGFTWASSPACTELETIVMDWLGKMIGLPSDFLHSKEQTLGGGVIQTTASDCTFVTLLGARAEMIRKVKATTNMEDAEINARLISYCSDQAHSSVEKACLIGLVKLRFLPSDEKLSLRGETLREAIEKDREEGLIPFYLCATLGTTGACAYDNLKELGPICAEEGIWMHIDAAYAGSAFICPEFRKYMAGVEHAQSFAFNPSKWLMVHFDCSAMWVKNSGALHRTFNVDPLYLKHDNSGAAIDYMHWQIALSRRFRAIKLWFVIRSFGVEGLQNHIRKGVELAKRFESLVQQDDRFEIPADRTLGFVVFRLKGDNELTELLLKRLNSTGRVHMVPASLKGRYIIRFTVTSQYTTPGDIEEDWNVIRRTADQVIEDLVKEEQEEEEIPVEEEEEEEEAEGAPSTRREEEEDEEGGEATRHAKSTLQRLPSFKKKDYGISLILSNVPMSPKVINGSFAALFENFDISEMLARHFRTGDLSSRALRLSPRKRGKLRDQNKQLSLDTSFFASKRQASRFKQSSLDSKIDDILEVSSVDSDYPGNGRRGADSPDDLDFDLNAVKIDNEADSPGGAVEEDDEPARGDAKRERTQSVTFVNGMHGVCKHCGRSFED